MQSFFSSYQLRYFDIFFHNKRARKRMSGLGCQLKPMITIELLRDLVALGHIKPKRILAAKTIEHHSLADQLSTDTAMPVFGL